MRLNRRLLALSALMSAAVPATGVAADPSWNISLTPVLSVAAVTRTVVEGNAAQPASFRLTLTRPRLTAVKVLCHLTGTATPGVDYLGTSTLVVTIPAGSTSVIVGLPTIADNVSDGSESIVLTLAATSDSSVQFGIKQAEVDILDPGYVPPPPTPTPPPNPGWDINQNKKV
jgi:hypothetical protein